MLFRRVVERPVKNSRNLQPICALVVDDFGLIETGIGKIDRLRANQFTRAPGPHGATARPACFYPRQLSYQSHDTGAPGFLP